jgi:integrase
MARLSTVKAIEAAKPKSKEYKLTVDRDLYLRIAPSGAKTWLVRYVVGGKQRQFTLPKPYGPSGEGFMSLSDARGVNAQVQALARAGVDYHAHLEQERQKQADFDQGKVDAELSFEDLFDAWTKDGVNRADGNKYIFQSFRKHALPFLGKLQIRRLTEHELRDLYRSVIADGKVATAVELSKDIRQMLRWGEKRKPWRTLMIDGNPSDLVEIKTLLPGDYTKDRTRRLSIDEIKKLNCIFGATGESYKAAAKKYGTERPLKREVQIATWLCLSTLCRIGELLKAEWKHVDFTARTWFIPASNTKGERGQKYDQLVHLSDFSLRQFKELHELTGESAWAFPARYKANEPVHAKSASKLVGDRQSKFKKRTKKLASRVESNSLVLGDEEWTLHDLRRTGATQMQRLKIHRDVINLCQNHVIGTKVDRVYLLDDYAEEKREAWHRLGDWLDSIFASESTSP